jgi:hypothetical protein
VFAIDNSGTEFTGTSPAIVSGDYVRITDSTGAVGWFTSSATFSTNANIATATAIAIPSSSITNDASFNDGLVIVEVIAQGNAYTLNSGPLNDEPVAVTGNVVRVTNTGSTVTTEDTGVSFTKGGVLYVDEDGAYVDVAPAALVGNHNSSGLTTDIDAANGSNVVLVEVLTAPINTAQ